MAIYFIQAADGAVKIGRANNVNRRLRNLQTAHAQELILLRTIEGGELEEWACQFEFRDLRIRGEWFQFSEQMLSFVPRELSKAVLLRQRHKENDNEYSLVNHVRAAIKHHPLKQKQIAQMMGLSASSLCRKLVQGPADSHRFTLDDLERYMTVTGDTQPVLYLVEKYLGCPENEIAALEKRLAELKSQSEPPDSGPLKQHQRRGRS